MKKSTFTDQVLVVSSAEWHQRVSLHESSVAQGQPYTHRLVYDEEPERTQGDGICTTELLFQQEDHFPAYVPSELIEGLCPWTSIFPFEQTAQCLVEDGTLETMVRSSLNPDFRFIFGTRTDPLEYDMNMLPRGHFTLYPNVLDDYATSEGNMHNDGGSGSVGNMKRCSHPGYSTNQSLAWDA